MLDKMKKCARNILPLPLYGSVQKTWRTARGALRRLATLLRSRSGIVGRLVRYPVPMSAPWRRSSLDIGRSGALGDVLMCTPALRELKIRNPAAYVRFYTNYPTLVRGLPYIDEIHTYEDRPKDTIILGYEDVIPPRAHLAKIMGDNLGLKVNNVRPDCNIDANIVRRFQDSWRLLPRPYIVVQKRASRWTPNKDWPEEYWINLIERLSQNASVIEIGDDRSAQNISSANYIDLRAQTSLEELVGLIAASDMLVGPVSGTTHIAAAFGIPAVVIVGGYEHPKNAAYAGHKSFYTAVSCAPCWLREACPHSLKCLRAIEPYQVESAVRTIWTNRKPSY